MNNLQELTLNNAAEEIRDIVEPVNVTDEIYIGLEHIEQRSLHLAGIGNSSEVVSAKKKFESSDILFGSLRPYFRKVIKPNFSGVCSTDITVIRAKSDFDQSFLFYFLANQKFIDYATNISNGTRMPRASWKVLCESKWLFPSYNEQKKIGEILSAYDDLIENNIRRIQILEEMAQTIYREWFVNFRFPGHEHVRMVESELGMIPEGWKVKLLQEIAIVQWGDTSVTKASYVQNGYDAYSASGLDGKLEYYDYDRKGIVLSAIGANCGKIWYATGKWSCIKNTILFYSRNDEISEEYLFLNFNNSDVWTRRGAAQPFISLGDARQIKVLTPRRELMKLFSNLIEPIFVNIKCMEQINLNLVAQRDLLLPKLISGEIEID